MLDRAEIPVYTVQIARFLIGKMLVQVLTEGVAAGRIVETSHMASATLRVMFIVASSHAIGRFSSNVSSPCDGWLT